MFLAETPSTMGQDVCPGSFRGFDVCGTFGLWGAQLPPLPPAPAPPMPLETQVPVGAQEPLKLSLPLESRRRVVQSELGGSPGTPTRGAPARTPVAEGSPISLARALESLPTAASPPSKIVSLEQELAHGTATSPAVLSLQRGLASGAALSPSVAESPMRFPPGLEPPPGTPSHGSVLHGSGSCQPCAWFWKRLGCRNGQNCSYCHTCPEGEITNRKKAKRALVRDARVASRTPLGQAGVSPLDFGLVWDFGALSLADALVSDHDSSTTTGSESETTPTFPSEDDGEPERKDDTDVGSRRASEAQCGPLAFFQEPPAPADAPPGLPGPRAASVLAAEQGALQGSPDTEAASPPLAAAGSGSTLHGTGACQPCAWIWKPSGCLRGEACSFCHLCSQGELKARKKAKHAVMRAQKTASPTVAKAAVSGLAALV